MWCHESDNSLTLWVLNVPTSLSCAACLCCWRWLILIFFKRKKEEEVEFLLQRQIFLLVTSAHRTLANYKKKQYKDKNLRLYSNICNSFTICIRDVLQLSWIKLLRPDTFRGVPEMELWTIKHARMNSEDEICLRELNEVFMWQTNKINEVLAYLFHGNKTILAFISSSRKTDFCALLWHAGECTFAEVS